MAAIAVDEVKDVEDDDPFEDLETSDPNSANVASLMIMYMHTGVLAHHIDMQKIIFTAIG